MIEIDLHYTDFAQAEPILRVADLLKDRGIQIADRKSSPICIRSDAVLLAQHTLLSTEVLNHRPEVLVLERADSAICWDRRTAQHSQVKRVFKVGVLHPSELNNVCWGRYHSTRIQPDSQRLPGILLNEQQLAKLVPLYNYAVYARMEPWLKRPLPQWTERNFLLNFAGTIDYGPDAPEISLHRQAAISAARQISGEHFVHAGRQLSRTVYDGALCQSRICVSPWGLGEICHRDLEALFAGCILIKPDTSFVSTWPPVFENGVSYLPCRADFADLANLTQRVLDCPGEMEEIRERNRAMLEKVWIREHLAQRISNLLTEALQPSPREDAISVSGPRPEQRGRVSPGKTERESPGSSSLNFKGRIPILPNPIPERKMTTRTPQDPTKAAFVTYGDTRYDACPICEGRETQAVWKIPFSRLEERLPVGNTNVQYLPMFGSRMIYEYSHCERCESLFLDPYRTSRKAQYASESNPGAIEKIRRASDRTHASWKSYEARYDHYLKPHLPGSGTLIDAACGAGQYLLLAQEDDQRTFDRLIGLEVSAVAVEHLHSLGIEAHACDLDMPACLELVPPNTADFVIFSEAFEHVVFPLRTMRHLVEMLKPGGRLFFSAQRCDELLPVRPGENHCLSAKGYSLLLERLNCQSVLTVERPGKWIGIIEKQ